MQVYSLRHSSCCGNDHLVGVYDSFAAMLNQLQIMGGRGHDDDTEQWKIECHDLEDANVTKERLDRVNNHYNNV